MDQFSGSRPVGPLVAVYLTNRFNSEQLRRQQLHEDVVRNEMLLRRRTEELYVMLQRYVTMLHTANLPYLRVMEGRLDYNQALDSATRKSKRSVDFHRIEMLIDIYFPNHQPAFKKLLAHRGLINDIRDAHKVAYLQSESGLPYVEPFKDALLGADAACKVLVAEIVANARQKVSIDFDDLKRE